MSKIIVTTGDIKQDYDILGPVYFQVSNKGLFGSALSKLVKKYSDEIASLKSSGSMSPDRNDRGLFLENGQLVKVIWRCIGYSALRLPVK